MRQNIFGAQSLRGSVATEGGGGGGGVSPPTVGSFFIFRLENVQSGTYLEGNFDEYLKITCMEELKISHDLI